MVGKGTSWFVGFAQYVSRATGRPVAFMLAAAAIVIWALSGPLFGIRGSVQEFSLTGLIIAFVGAVILLAIVNLIQRRRIR